LHIPYTVAEKRRFSSDVIVMGLRRKLNMLTSYSIELVFVWTCCTKYVALNTVCMIFCLL